jgi:hypothetical protein
MQTVKRQNIVLRSRDEVKNANIKIMSGIQCELCTQNVDNQLFKIAILKKGNFFWSLHTKKIRGKEVKPDSGLTASITLDVIQR